MIITLLTCSILLLVLGILLFDTGLLGISEMADIYDAMDVTVQILFGLIYMGSAGILMVICLEIGTNTLPL